jgi:hypothetical protein
MGSSSLESELSACALVIGRERADVDETDPEFPLRGHKLGGVPYLHQNDVEAHEEVSRLHTLGYRQWLQLDIPSGREGPVAGSWPFGDCIFHLFARTVPTGVDWMYFWS